MKTWSNMYSVFTTSLISMYMRNVSMCVMYDLTTGLAKSRKLWCCDSKNESSFNQPTNQPILQLFTVLIETHWEIKVLHLLSL